MTIFQQPSQDLPVPEPTKPFSIPPRPSSTPSAEFPEAVRPAKKRRRPLLIALAILAVVVVIGGLLGQHLEAGATDTSVWNFPSSGPYAQLPLSTSEINAIQHLSGYMKYKALVINDPKYPAELSPTFITDILRDQFGYDGVLLTDALYMEGITDTWSMDTAAVIALQAGNDMLLGANGTQQTIDMINAIKQALNDGQLTVDRIDESVTRIIALKMQYHLMPTYVPGT